MKTNGSSSTTRPAYEYTGPGERIPVEMRGNYIIIRAEVLLYGADEPLEAMFLLDTGVRVSVFNSPYAKKHALAAQSPRTLTGVTGFGIGGASNGIIGRVRGIRIGSFRFDEPVMTFSTDARGALADTSFAGIIGADFLSRFTVVLDYRRSQIFLEKNSGFDAPFEFDMCGIRFAMEGERFDLFKVFMVYEGTPAALAGIAAGDVVTAIDGRAAGSFTREEHPGIPSARRGIGALHDRARGRDEGRHDPAEENDLRRRGRGARGSPDELVMIPPRRRKSIAPSPANI